MSFKKEKLGNISEIVSGSTPDTTEKDFWDGEINWVTPKDLSGLESAYLNETPRKITQAGLQSCSSRMLPSGSVLFSSRAPIGHVAINTVPMCSNQGFKSFVPDSTQLFNKYLYYWLKANRPMLENLGNGATFKEVSKAIISNVEIPLPPLDEQKRIAAVLDKADEVRRKRRQAIKKLDELLQSVFLDMFGDPVSNPKGWEKVKFEEVCETKLGKMLDEKKQAKTNQRPYLRNANVQWNYVDTSSVFEMYFDEREQQLFKLQYGDLLICEGGEVGRTAIWRNELPECYYQKAIHRGKPKIDKTTSEYLLFLMFYLAQLGGLKNHVTVATIAHLTSEKLKSLKIPLPLIELQKKFTEDFEKIEQTKRKLLDASIKLESLFQSLQQRAFAGELFGADELAQEAQAESLF